jgi:inner membrane protein
VDNLTHSLVGALLGRMGLRSITPHAMPALILSANLPDVDSFVAPLWGEPSLAAHRGFTHGVGGLVIMPFLAAAIILLCERLLISKKGRSPPRRREVGERVPHSRKSDEGGTASPWPLPRATCFSTGALLLVCFLGTLSHPLLDFLNTYGTRLAEPFSHRWFYGDTLFIMDPWIWLALIVGLELSWRAERLRRNWRKPAVWAFVAVLGYVGLNAAISLRAVAVATPLVERVGKPQVIVAGEVPLEFWKRRIIWRGDEVGGTGEYDLLKGINHVVIDPEIVPLRMDDRRIGAAAKADKYVRAFLFWTRMPIVVVDDGRSFLTDQRFYDNVRRVRRGTFLIPLDNQPSNS